MNDYMNDYMRNYGFMSLGYCLATAVLTTWQLALVTAVIYALFSGVIYYGAKYVKRLMRP